MKRERMVRAAVAAMVAGWVLAAVGCRLAHASSQERLWEERRDTTYFKQGRRGGFLVVGKFVERDTLFYVQDFDTTGGHLLRRTAIYRISERKPEYLRTEFWTADFFEGYLLDPVELARDQQKRGHLPPFRKVDVLGLPGHWLPLYHIDGRPCVFKHCVPTASGERLLTDSLVYNKLRPHMSYWPLRGSEHPSDDIYHFTMADEHYSDLYIYILDRDTGAAIWKYSGLDDERYNLMIPASSAARFEMLFSKNGEEPYFGSCWLSVFDKIDLKALWNWAKAGKPVDIHNLKPLYGQLNAREERAE